MGLLDSLKKAALKAASEKLEEMVDKAIYKDEVFEFSKIPETLEELKALPEANLDSPFKTASLTVVALYVFSKNKSEGEKMLNFLKGPSPLTPMEKQFISDRFMDKKEYIIRSYFAGSNPDNNYEPSVPYKIKVESNAYSFDDENYATLHIKSSGADSLRQVRLRLKPSTKQWFLNEQFLLSDIRKPKELDPWA